MKPSQLILGTAALGGQPYGGKLVEEYEAIQIMARAYELGIRQFDTSPSYGNAERRLGDYFEGFPGLVFYSKNSGQEFLAGTSMKALRRMPIFLLHNWNGWGMVPAWMSGVSIYSADTCATWAHRYLQVDWNLLNQTPLPIKTPPRKVFVRSVLLQGVLAGGPIPRNDLTERVERAQAVADHLGLSLKQLAMAAACNHPDVDGVVIGPTSVDELRELVEMASMEMNLFPGITLLDAQDNKLTDPRTWK